MSEDGHKYFFGSMPEMPWKRKEREMDNEFKKLVIRMIAAILVLETQHASDKVIADNEEELLKLIEDVNAYIRKLG